MLQHRELYITNLVTQLIQSYLGDIFMEHLKQRLKEEDLSDTSIDEIVQYVRDMIKEACDEVEDECLEGKL